MPLPPKGTPERRAYMKALGRKGGKVTMERHPEQLAQMAVQGGRATAGNTRNRMKPEPAAPAPPKPNVAVMALDDILAALEAPRD